MPQLKDLVTDEFGTSYNLIAVGGCFGFALGLILYTIHCWVPIAFNLMEYAGGYASMLAATAAALRIQPPALPPQQ